MKSDREELELFRTIRVVLENGDRLAKDAEYLWEMDRFPLGIRSLHSSAGGICKGLLASFCSS